MQDIEIRINEIDGALEVLSGHRRLKARLSIGQTVEAVDIKTGKRYLIEQIESSLVATEILVH